MIRETVSATDRRAMTPARRRRIIEAHGGCCARPGCGISTGLQIDHIIPVWMGGAEEDHNLEPLCEAHHKEKTAADAKARAKVKRLLEPKPPKGNIKGRSFPPRGSGPKIPSRKFEKRR